MKLLKKYSPMKTLVLAFMLLSGGLFAQQKVTAPAQAINTTVREDVPSTANLDKFDAKVVDGTVKINWVLTKQEAQAKLIIEKSSDGVNYSYLGKLPAIASPNKITYTCRDNSPADGNNYYRLKTVSSTNVEYIYDETAHVNTREPEAPKTVMPLAAETPFDFEKE